MKKFISLFTLLIFTAITCKKEEVTPINLTFDQMVEALPYPFDEVPATPEPPLVSDSFSVGSHCVIEKYDQAAGYAEAILLDPSTDIVVPGMIIEPGSLAKGNYTAVTEARHPITITHSANNQSVEVLEPSLATIREGIQQLNEAGGVNPANFTYEFETVNSEQDLKIKLAGHYKNPWVKVSASMSWDNERIHSRMLAKFVQVFYSIDIVPHDRPSEWFLELPNTGRWKSTPTYISSVKYGRIGILIIESEANHAELQAGLNASFSAAGHSGGFDLSGAYESLWEKTTMKALVIGGNPDEAVKTINGFDGFKQWILSSASFGETSPGSPVAYSMRYLKDNTIAEIVLAGSYELRTCYPLPEYIKPLKSDYMCPILYGEGDNKFAGHGPMQNASVDIFINPSGYLMARYYYNVIEYEGGKEGDSKGMFLDTLWISQFEEGAGIPEGYVIDAILSNTHSISGPVYDDAAGPVFWPAGGNPPDELVYQFEMNGDVGGPDLIYLGQNCPGDASVSYLRVLFNPIKVRFRKAFNN